MSRRVDYSVSVDIENRAITLKLVDDVQTTISMTEQSAVVLRYRLNRALAALRVKP